MKLQTFSKRIMALIGNDDLKTAIKEMSHLLKNSKKLDEVIIQSARLNDLMQQIRIGTIPREDANINKNQIRYALVDLLREIENNASTNSDILTEIEAVKFPTTQINITQTHSGQGDNVGGDKMESHEHLHFKGHEPEKKNAFFYYLEVFIIFLIPTGIAGGIGAAAGQGTGAIIGALIGAVIGLVNAGSVKRTKGLL